MLQTAIPFVAAYAQSTTPYPVARTHINFKLGAASIKLLSTLNTKGFMSKQSASDNCFLISELPSESITRFSHKPSILPQYRGSNLLSAIPTDKTFLNFIFSQASQNARYLQSRSA